MEPARMPSQRLQPSVAPRAGCSLAFSPAPACPPARAWSQVLGVLCTLISSPPLILYYIFLPCWNCSDFEAAALHEIGHLLGLGHPDAAPASLHPQVRVINENPMANQTYHPWLAAGGKVNETNCYTLWDNALYGVPPGLPADEYTVGAGGYRTRPSVMQAFTQNNPRTLRIACLQPCGLRV